MEQEQKLYRILTIDGGGVKGILSGRILEALEAKLNNLYEKKFGHPRKTPIRVAEYFDLVAGTSTGGILTCLLLHSSMPKPEGATDKSACIPDCTATDAVNLYIQHCEQIFKKTFWGTVPFLTGLGGPKFQTDSYEKLLKKYFKSDRMSDLIRPCLIASYDIEARKAVFFTLTDALKDKDYNYSLSQVIRATSAAPTYFPPEEVKSPNIKNPSIYGVDGGLFANNPSMCAFVEAIKMNVGILGFDKFFIVSLGLATRQKSYDFNKALNWGLLGWINPILSIMMSGVSETVDYQLRKIYGAIQKPNQYHRIVPDLGDADTAIELTTPKNVKALSVAGIEGAKKANSDLDYIAQTIFDQQHYEL